MSGTTTKTVIDIERAVRPVKIKLNGGGSRGGGNGRKGGGNSGGGGDNNNGGYDDSSPGNFSPVRYWIGMYITLAAVLMTFATLVVAYVARVGTAKNWYPVELPRLLWLSTALILASSLAFEIARRNLKRRDARRFQNWMLLTLLLGASFLASQLAVFRQLLAQNITLANNSHSAFFYLLTGAHGLHLLGGLIALSYLLLRQQRAHHSLNGNIAEHRKQRTLGDVVALYWHFIDGLWVFLFALLFLWK
ncbi:MAG: heme-copper oxidase subunit III [Pyrinomonadaceae bacterium]